MLYIYRLQNGSFASGVSEALYVGLCHYIGTPTDLEVHVTIRREVIDIDGKIRTTNFAY